MTRDVDRSALVLDRVPAHRILGCWTAHDWRGGIRVDEMSAFERLIVRTSNSTYHIVLVDPPHAAVLVRGGAFFPVFAPARLAGSSLGGGLLKLRTVHVGFCLELGTERGSIITSRVRDVTIAAPTADANDVM